MLKNYYCKECGEKISGRGKTGMCVSCAYKKDKRPKTHCIDCGKEVSNRQNKRCWGCHVVNYCPPKGENSPFFDKRHTEKTKQKIRRANLGTNNPNYIDGRSKIKHYCIDCGKLLNNSKAKRCSKCFHKYIVKNKILKGIIKTKEWRRKIGETLIRKGCCKGKNNGMFGKITHGKWQKYKGIYMRSSYEVKYAKYLDKNKVNWQYEPKAFDLGTATYRPDFYLPKENLYIEIKGYWRADAKEKYKLFKKKYSNIKIKIFNQNILEKMGVI